MIVELPGLPPTLNHVYWHLPSGRKKIKPAAEDYRLVVISKARRELDDLEQYHPPVLRYSVMIELWSPFWMTKPKKKGSIPLPSKRAGDLDNRVKFLLDCLQQALGFNDAQVFELRVVKREHETDHTTVTLDTLPF